MIKIFLYIIFSFSFLTANSITKNDLIKFSKIKKPTNTSIQKNANNTVKTNNTWYIKGYKEFRIQKLQQYIKAKSKIKPKARKSRKSFADVMIENKFYK